MLEENVNKYRTPISTEDGQNYNMTYKQNGKIVSPMNNIPIDRWPFKNKNETIQEFNDRMNKLKTGI
jgi:hypothetical protein